MRRKAREIDMLLLSNLTAAVRHIEKECNLSGIVQMQLVGNELEISLRAKVQKKGMTAFETMGICMSVNEKQISTMSPVALHKLADTLVCRFNRDITKYINT